MFGEACQSSIIDEYQEEESKEQAVSNDLFVILFITCVKGSGSEVAWQAPQTLCSTSIMANLRCGTQCGARHASSSRRSAHAATCACTLRIANIKVLIKWLQWRICSFGRPIIQKYYFHFWVYLLKSGLNEKKKLCPLQCKICLF